jgi:hypothetical protein
MDDYRGQVGFLPIQMLEVEIHESVTVRFCLCYRVLHLLLLGLWFL